MRILCRFAIFVTAISLFSGTFLPSRLAAATFPQITWVKELQNVNMANPRRLDVDGQGNLYVADQLARSILKFDRFGAYVRDYAVLQSNGKGVAVTRDGQKLYVSTKANTVIIINTADGSQAGTLTGVAIGVPDEIDLDADGNIFVGDSGIVGGTLQNNVKKFSPEGAWLATFGGAGTGVDKCSFFGGMTVNPQTSRVYIIDASIENPRLHIFGTDGVYQSFVSNPVLYDADNATARGLAFEGGTDDRVFALRYLLVNLRVLDSTFTKLGDYNNAAGKLTLVVDVVYDPTTQQLYVTDGSGVDVFHVADGYVIADSDGDGVNDNIDNCPSLANADQANFDGDALGDACDPDDDNDGVADGSDAFPLDPMEWADADVDGIGDNADNCPFVYNPDQADADSDGVGDACPGTGPTISLAPATYATDYQGVLRLTVGNLATTSTPTIYVEQVIDANRNGLVDASEPSIRAFRVRDNQSILGGENLRDLDPAAGVIAVDLNLFDRRDLHHASGQTIFWVNDGKHTLKHGLTVTPLTAAQSLSGVVTDGADPLPGVLVQLAGEGFFSAGVSAITDAGGQYTLPVAQPGTYHLNAFDYSGQHLTDAAGWTEVLTVGAGQHLSGVDRVLAPAMRTISGSAGAGVLVEAACADGSSSRTLTYDNGGYVLGVPAANCTVYLLPGESIGSHPSSQGLVGFYTQELAADATAGNLSGKNFTLTPATALASGTVRDESGTALAGMPVEAVDGNAAGMPAALSVSSASGGYRLGLASGNTWSITVKGENIWPQGLLSSHIDSYTVAGGPVSGNDLTVYAATAWAEGTVTESGSGTPLVGIDVQGWTVDGTLRSGGRTDIDGWYRMPLRSGMNWHIDALTEMGGKLPVNDVVVVPGASETVTVNFSAITPPPDDLDGDGLPNSWELANGLDPYSAVGANGPSGDPDGDGLTNVQEYAAGTNPKLADTDGDGIADGTDPDPLVKAVVAAPASITVPANSTTGNYTVSWGESATTGATYTLEESTAADFASGPVTVVTTGLTAISASISGKDSCVYYYRVKAVKVPMTDSAWIASSSITVSVRKNVALAANGGVATASSTYPSNPSLMTLATVNDGDRRGTRFWGDNTPNVSPDWVQITFSGQKTINEIDVFNLQDNYSSLLEPTEAMVGTLYPNTSFNVEYWNGTNWVVVPGGNITGNNKIWNKVTFTPITTSQIRVYVTGNTNGYSMLTEVEAYTGTEASTPTTVSLTAPTEGASYIAPGTIDLAATVTEGTNFITSKVEFYQGTTKVGEDTVAPYTFQWTSVGVGSYTLTARAVSSLAATVDSAAVNVTVTDGTVVRTNVASTANGGVATASSTYVGAAIITLSSVNDGDRKGGLFWGDNTPNVSPDWVQITFSGQKTINEIDVFNLQDNYSSLLEPTEAMVGTLYPNTSFNVEYWNGTNWVVVPGGNITGNNKIWNKVTFTPITTSQIRVYVTGNTNGYSMLTEVEAYTGTEASTPTTVSLTAPTEEASYIAPAAITLDAGVTAGIGRTSSKVEFYQGAVKLGEDLVA
ncbi:MAG: hypothetical protein FIB02_11515, partial [Desulfuromonas sp.]|nr:hypothetical protein [Desulfuromonas sp.]